MRYFLFLFALLSVEFSWASCQSVNNVAFGYTWQDCHTMGTCNGVGDMVCSGKEVGKCSEQAQSELGKVYKVNAYYFAVVSVTGYDNCWTSSVCFQTCSGCAGTFGYLRCDTKAEADSVVCLNGGGSWNGSSCVSCDSTKFVCETKTEQKTEQTGGDQITCVNGTCYGVPACKYWSTFSTYCISECGTSPTLETYSTDPIFIEGTCDTADFEGECSPVKCTQIDDRYIIYQTCATNNINNGELQMIPKIQSAGKGTCASQGYPNEPFGGNSSSSANADSVSNECLLFGACSSYSSDTTDYSNPFNRDADHGCTCDDDGGSARISRITCPDGSVSIEVGTCQDWNNKHSSSSTATPSSSSAAEGGGTDSTGGDWATSGQAEDIKDSLGSINSTLKAIGDFLSAMNPAWSSGEVGELTPAMIEAIFGAGEYDGIDSSGVDDVPTWVDSLSVDSVLYNDRLDSMFGALPTTNTLLDTLNFDHSSKCPVFRVPIFTHWFENEVTINCASLGGFDLCSIGSTLAIMMATAFVLMFQIKMIIRAFAG